MLTSDGRVLVDENGLQNARNRKVAVEKFIKDVLTALAAIALPASGVSEVNY